MMAHQFISKNFYIPLGLLLLAGTACKHKPKYPGPLSPQESMKTFHFADSFKAELYAAEPLVADPVSMIFDEQGNAYVVEMADANMPDSLKGKGRIVMLKDTNGDGQADTAIVFAEGLKEATSILPWKGGLIATAAPDILYLKDTTGDGKADLKKVLFSGFFQDNDEAQITSLCFSVDNWIYANNDGEPGEVTSHEKPDAPKLSMQGADFRFRLDRNEFERTTGPGQFGQAIDDWGHRFFTKNSLHIQQVVIPWRYLNRNPYLPPSARSAIKNISDHDPIMYQLTPAPYWRAERTRRRNKEYQENHLNRVEYAKDHFSGASGGTFYGGDAFPKEYYGSIFTGDVSGNLVHRDVLAQPTDTNDPFYTAERGKGEEKQEFLAATDSWFRPTSFSVGPDGDLYVVDMYRQHIETPVSIPDDLKADMDFSAGSNYGRIYRIVPDNAGPYKKISPDLYKMSSADLVKLLANPNQWWRIHAHKLLIERQDKTVIPDVKTLFNQSQDPRTRLEALYVLDGLDALNAEAVSQALKDPEPGVRENAAILSERFPQCLPQLEKMINDSSARVAFQATLSLGQFKGKDVISALAHVAESRGENSWFRTAVLSADTSSSIELIKALAAQKSFFQQTAPWKLTFLGDVSYIIGARNRKEQVTALLDLLTQSPMTGSQDWQSACLKGLMQGLENAASAALKEKLKDIESNSGNNINKEIQDLKNLFSKA
jgi:putative membrane-bound dehydrogenase-like protein